MTDGYWALPWARLIQDVLSGAVSLRLVLILSMRDFVMVKVALEGIYVKSLWFSTVSNIPPTFHTPSFICDRCHLILATDS
jgi:hypothetical protein